MSGSIEANGINKNDAIKNTAARHEHMSYSINSVLASVAFLEAEVNTLYADSGEFVHRFVGLPAEALRLLSAVWSIESVRRSTNVLDKYQVALKVCNLPIFDPGAQPYQDAKLLIELRNALVHFIPASWTVDSDGNAVDSKAELRKLTQGLRNKFSLNPFFREYIISGASINGGPPVTPPSIIKAPFFPDKCVGFGCTEWGLKSSLHFVDDFYNRLGVKGSYEYVRSYLVANNSSV